MSYVGSAIDLTRRLRDYFYLSFLKKEVAFLHVPTRSYTFLHVPTRSYTFLHVPTKNNSRIYRALLKHGYSNFSI
jgi:hypothetical protein